MKNTRQEKYEAMGFIEALIAIMVVGIAATVLMQISASTTQKMIQNERIDQMTQYAVEGAVMAQTIADKSREEGSGIFPNLPGSNVCLRMVKTADNKYQFAMIGNGNFETFSINERNTYKKKAVVLDNLGQTTEFWRIICIDFPTTTNHSFLVAKVVVGQTMTDGKITRANEIKDYEYYTAIKL